MTTLHMQDMTMELSMPGTAMPMTMPHANARSATTKQTAARLPHFQTF
jgi:hypothetical protein